MQLKNISRDLEVWTKDKAKKCYGPRTDGFTDYQNIINTFRKSSVLCLIETTWSPGEEIKMKLTHAIILGFKFWQV